MHFEPGRGAYDIADALATADVAHALTGDAGANLYRSSAGEAWPVLYVENVARAVESTWGWFVGSRRRLGCGSR